MKNRYIVVRDSTAKKVGGTRNVIYDAHEKITIFRKKTKHKDDRYWHSHDQALLAVARLESGAEAVTYNARYDFYHLNG